MGRLFEEGVNWFVKMMENSTSSSDYVEFSRNTLQISPITKLSIKSNFVDIKILFAAGTSFYSVMSCSDVPKDAVHVTVSNQSDTCEIMVVEDSAKLKSQNVFVSFHLNVFIETLVVESNAGDITLSGCRAGSTSIATDSGDIAVSNHISPCQITAASKNGDVSGLKIAGKKGKHKLNCSTLNGDILLT